MTYLPGAGSIGAYFTIVDEPDLPWRAEGKVLSLISMRTMERFEQLIDADPESDVLRRGSYHPQLWTAFGTATGKGRRDLGSPSVCGDFLL